MKYGQFYKDGGTGPFGFGLTKAPTFKDALGFLARFTRILADLEVFYVTIEQYRITVERSYSLLITRTEQFADYSSVALIRHLRSCAGEPFENFDAKLERKAPLNKSLHVSVFSKNLKFGADTNSVVFSHELLSRPNPSADPIMFEYMSAQCEQIANSVIRKKELVTLLRDDFALHTETGDRSIDTAAKRLGMSERTLQRRLSDAVTTFWDVYEDTREDMSEVLLSDSNLSLEQISHKLGFSTQSAYSRFIKRRTGTTPGDIRKKAKNSA